MGNKKSKTADNTIAQNRIARHDYFIDDDIEVGMALEGWEVKSLRAGNLQLKESYVMVKPTLGRPIGRRGNAGRRTHGRRQSRQGFFLPAAGVGMSAR